MDSGLIVLNYNKRMTGILKVKLKQIILLASMVVLSRRDEISRKHVFIQFDKDLN